MTDGPGGAVIIGDPGTVGDMQAELILFAKPGYESPEESSYKIILVLRFVSRFLSLQLYHARLQPRANASGEPQQRALLRYRGRHDPPMRLSHSVG